MTFERVAASIFAIVAVGHAYRAVAQLPFQIGAFAVPESVSLVGALVAAALSVWGFRTRR